MHFTLSLRKVTKVGGYHEEPPHSLSLHFESEAILLGHSANTTLTTRILLFRLSAAFEPFYENVYILKIPEPEGIFKIR